MSNHAAPSATEPQTSVSELCERLRASAPLLGDTRLVLIDGPAGSGKTTLANRLAIALGGEPSAGAGSFDPASPLPADAPVQILHADDMYEGWEGLPVLGDVLVDRVLVPMAAGDDGGFEMWDWERSRRSHHISVPQRDVLVIEGVGVGMCSARAHANLLLWIEAPREVSLTRGLARDGEDYRDQWLAWQATEWAEFERQGTAAAADVAFDGTVPIPD